MKTREPRRTGIQVSPYRPGTMMFDQVANTCVRIIHVSCTPPAINRPALRRRPADERAAA